MLSRSFDAVFLDLDNTLYPYDVCHAQGSASLCTLAAERFGCSTKDAALLYGAAREVIGKRLRGTGASHHRLLYAQIMCERSGVSPVPHARDLERSYWDAYMDAMKLRPGVIEFAQGATRQGVKIGLITDLVVSVQLEKIHRLALAAHLNCIVTSEEAGVEKPSQAIFRLAMEKLGVEPARSLMVGDDLEKDVRGALAAGMSACWLTTKTIPQSGFHVCQDFAAIAALVSAQTAAQ